MRKILDIFIPLFIFLFSCHFALSAAKAQDIESNLAETLPESFLNPQPEKLKQEKKVILVPQPPKRVTRPIIEVPEKVGEKQVLNFYQIKKENPQKKVTVFVKRPPKKVEVLGKVKPSYSVSISVNEHYDSNIFNAKNNHKDDFFTVFAPNFSASIPTDNTTNNVITFSSGLSFTRHREFVARDDNVWVNSISFSHKFVNTTNGTKKLTIGYLLVSGYDDQFDNHAFNLHRPQIGFSHNGIKLAAKSCDSNKHICPSLGYSVSLRRSFFDLVDNQENSSIVGVVSIASRIPSRWTILPGSWAWSSSASLTGVWYDNHVLGDRNDLSFNLDTGLRWTVNKAISLATSIAYTSRDSSIDPLDYNQFGLTAGAKLSVTLN